MTTGVMAATAEERKMMNDVSSREYIAWQCGGKTMTLDRLAQVCGCFTLNDLLWKDGCRHPKTPNGQCVGRECPIAFVDYPPDASDDELAEFDSQYTGEMDMTLKDDGNAIFGQGGQVTELWEREYRSHNTDV